MIGKRVYALLLVLLVMATAQAWGAVEGGSFTKELYVVETEGLKHSFSAILYKVSDNGVQEARVEEETVNSISPVYDTRKDVGTSFSTPEEAKQAAKKVFGDEQVQQMISNVFGYSVANQVGKVHISFLYRCKINGKDKGILLHYDINLNQSQKLSDFLLHPPSTSGYLIVDKNPIWVKISYSSRTLDPSLKNLSTYNEIKTAMDEKGILGRLIIQEMNLDGTVEKDLVDTQIKDDRFEMPVSGNYTPEVYISKIIDAYKDTIQKDSPLYIMVDYLENPTIATDKNGSPKISIEVTKKEILVKQIGKIGGWSCTGYGGYGDCLYIDEKGNVYAYWRSWWDGKAYLSSTVHSNIFHGPYRCYDGYGPGGPDKYDEPFSCTQICVGKGVVRACCAQCHCHNCGPTLNVFTQKGKTASSYGWGLEVDHGRIRLCLDTCGQWINLIPRYRYDYYRTAYHISYGIGGLIERYLVTEPLKKIPVSSTEYYYAMNEILSAQINYDNTALGVSSGYNIVKTASGTQWERLKARMQGKTKEQVRSMFRYLVVDPFKTNEIIDVRNDTVNGLDESDYRNWDIPVTFVMQ